MGNVECVSKIKIPLFWRQLAKISKHAAQMNGLSSIDQFKNISVSKLIIETGLKNIAFAL